jgi:hypothetical protein
MPAKHNHTSFGVRPRDHCMPFTKIPLGQSCILLRIPHLGPLLHQADPRYSQSSLITKQAIPYWTCGGTYYPGGSTPKNRSLADSSKNHPQTIKVSTFPTLSLHCSNPGIYQIWVHSHRTGWKTRNHHSSTFTSR